MWPRRLSIVHVELAGTMVSLMDDAVFERVEAIREGSDWGTGSVSVSEGGWDEPLAEGVGSEFKVATTGR